jgi:hypothetical protein
MNRSSCVVSAACLLLVTGSGAAPAGDAGIGGIVPCTISAWSTDKGSMGLKVRAGPSASAAIIARLPPPVEVDGYTFAPEVSITGSKSGWFRIDRATMDNYVEEREPKVVFKGEGWVSGRLLGLQLNDMDLHHGPSESAPMVRTLLKDAPDGKTHGPDSFVVDRLNDCQGDWVEVEGSFLGAYLRGWAKGTCSNQVTTCP